MVHMADLIGLCLDQPIIDWNAIPTFRYTPVLQDVSLLPGMLGMMSSISGRQLIVGRLGLEIRANSHPTQKIRHSPLSHQATQGVSEYKAHATIRLYCNIGSDFRHICA
jgi:hypothetical protein